MKQYKFKSLLQSQKGGVIVKPNLLTVMPMIPYNINYNVKQTNIPLQVGFNAPRINIPIDVITPTFQESKSLLEITSPNLTLGVSGTKNQLAKILNVAANIKQIKSKQINDEYQQISDEQIFRDNTNDNSSNTTNYSGAGVLIIENYYDNRKGRSEPAILLFKSSTNSEYQELGGSVDTNLTSSLAVLQQTAKRELREESCNLFNIRAELDRKINEKNMFVDINTSNGSLYRCYVVGIEGMIFGEDVFDINCKLVKEQGAPSHWKETNDVKRFFISDLIKCITLKNNMCLNADGNNCKIRQRTIDVLAKIVNGYNSDNSIANNAINFTNKIKVFSEKNNLQYDWLFNTVRIDIL
jgi:hypothetical protein